MGTAHCVLSTTATGTTASRSRPTSALERLSAWTTFEFSTSSTSGSGGSSTCLAMTSIGGPENGRRLDRVAAPAVRLEPDVVRLEIAVDDPAPVRLVDRRARLLEDVDDPLEREAALLGEDVGERAPVEVLHHEVGDLLAAHRGEAEVGDVDDVRVAKAPGRLRLAPEPLDELGAARHPRHDHLERDDALRADVLRLIHGPHAALAKQADDRVLAVE